VDDLEPGREEHERDEREEEKPSEVGALLRVAGGAAGAAEEKPEQRGEGEENGGGFFAEELAERGGKADEIGGGNAVAVEIAEEGVRDAEPDGAEPFAAFEYEMVEYPDDPGGECECGDEAGKKPGARTQANEAPVENFCCEEDEDGEVVGIEKQDGEQSVEGQRD